MSSPERFQLLCEKYLDQALSATEREELRESLRGDGGRRSDFAQLLVQEHSLRTLQRGAVPGAQPQSAERSSHRVGRPLRHPLRHPRRSGARARTPGRGPATIGTAVLLTAILVLAFAWHLHDRRAARLTAVARLSEVQGASIVPGTDPSARPHPAHAGDAVAAGDRIETASQGRCSLAWLAEGTTVRLAGDTDLVLSEPPSGTHLALEHGGITASVAHQPAGRPFTLGTPQATITVVGTRFSLLVDPQRTRLEVQEGVVSCGGDLGAALAVPAGGAAEVLSGQRAQPAAAATATASASAPAPASMAAPAGVPAHPPAGQDWPAFGPWQVLATAEALHDGWGTFSGSWSVSDGILSGEIDPVSHHARLDSRRILPQCEFECSIRGVRCAYAEFGIHAFGADIPIALGTKGQWHAFHVVVHGTTTQATLDGAPIAPDGVQIATGNVGFYASSDQAQARVEIRDVRWRE